MKNALCAMVLAALVLASAPAAAKSLTIRIEIGGAGLAAPLEITEVAILERFSIWYGPGVRVNGQPIHLRPGDPEQVHSCIDWPRGAVPTHPSALRRYKVIFHQGGREPMHEWHRRYVVRYEYDPTEKGGYIYLPGKNDGDDYQRNVFSIAHGVEGNWFHSSAAWERLVRPLIDEAVATAR